MAVRRKTQTSAFVEAGDALEERDDEALLDALLRAWRKHRIAAIADAIDVVSSRLPAREDLGRGTAAAKNQRWLAVAKQKDARDLGALLSAPWPAMWMQAKPRVAALSAFEDDPRVASAFMRLLEEMPWTSIASATVYSRIASTLAKLGDVRGVEKLREIANKPNKHFDHEKIEKLLKRAANEAAKSAATVVPLDASDEPRWREIESALVGSKDTRLDEEKTNDQFLREIHADPDDEVPRRVYADWLIERSDPLGELIVLQCERAAGRSNKASLKREKELLEAHRTKWLGPIAGVAGKDGATFERGFLARVDMKLHGEESLRSLVGDPRWSTVRAVSFGFLQGYRYSYFEDDIAAFLRHDTSRALRFVQGAEARAIAKALEGRAVPWEALAVSSASMLGEEVSLFERSLPSLRHLGLVYVTPEHVRHIIDAPVFDRIETLTTGYSGIASSLRDWGAMLARRSCKNLRVVRLCGDGESWILDAKVPLILRRDEQGKWTHLRIEGQARPSALSYFSEQIVSILEAAEGLERVEVEISRGVTEAHKAPIEAYAKRAKLQLTFV